MSVYFFIFNIVSSTRKEGLPTCFTTLTNTKLYSWHRVEKKCLSNEGMDV